MPSPLLTRDSLVRISNELFSNARLRDQFIANPAGYVREHYGATLTVAEQTYFRDIGTRLASGTRIQDADGWCCKGCAC